MSVIRWNPLREIDDLFARAGHFAPTGETRSLNQSAGFIPPADVSETSSNYFIELELPGVAAQDVDVSVHEGVVTIAGERKALQQAEGVLNDTDEEVELKKTHRRARRYGAFERRFRLPKDAQVDAIEASASEGVLSVSIGRSKEAARRAIEVRVA